MRWTPVSALPRITDGAHFHSDGHIKMIGSLWFLIEPKEHYRRRAFQYCGPILRVHVSGRTGEGGTIEAWDSRGGHIRARLVSFDEARAFVQGRWLEQRNAKPRPRPEIVITYE